MGGMALGRGRDMGKGWVMGGVRGTDWERNGVIGRVRVCVVGDGWFE